MSEDCSRGRVRHPATHQETVQMKHWKHGKDTETGTVCSDHFTRAADWEVDDWEVVSIKRRRI